MVVVGAFARLLPHPWNFTPMLAIGLYAGAKIAKLQTGILATLGALLVSDAVMGFYKGMWYVYGAWLLTILIGRSIRHRDDWKSVAAGAVCASLLFFLVTNFMVWAVGHLYPHTAAGLVACFVAATPFYQNQLLGDIFYTLVLFGGHALLTRLVQPTPRTV